MLESTPWTPFFQPRRQGPQIYVPTVTPGEGRFLTFPFKCTKFTNNGIDPLITYPFLLFRFNSKHLQGIKFYTYLMKDERLFFVSSLLSNLSPSPCLTVLPPRPSFLTKDVRSVSKVRSRCLRIKILEVPYRFSFLPSIFRGKRGIRQEVLKHTHMVLVYFRVQGVLPPRLHTLMV